MEKNKSSVAATRPAGKEDESLQNLEFSQEDEFAMEEVRWELFRRKELALIEMQKMVAEASRKPNVKS